MASKEVFKTMGILTPTKEDLIEMGPAAVRQILEAQGRYSRKRHREHAYQASTGKVNNVRNFARVLGINLGYQVPDTSQPGGMKWWHKGKQMLIEEIVRVIHEGAAPKRMRLRGKQTPRNGRR